MRVHTVLSLAVLLASLPASNASAQPPTTLGENTSKLGDLPPLAPAWFALQYVDLIGQDRFPAELLEDLRSEERAASRIASPNNTCLVQHLGSHHRGRLTENRSLPAILKAYSFVAVGTVQAAIPGLAQETFSSALTVSPEEMIIPPGPPPEASHFVLYPAVDLRSLGFELCIAENGYPPVPQPGDQVLVALRTSTESDALDWSNSIIVGLSPNGPNLPAWLRGVPESAKASSSSFENWIRAQVTRSK